MALVALLAAETIAFGVAAATHAGLLVRGFAHFQAGLAEAVIASVLATALVVAVALPRWRRAASVLAQSFALIGTSIGILTIAIGVGPQTVPDVVFHVAAESGLLVGIAYAARSEEAWRAA